MNIALPRIALIISIVTLFAGCVSLNHTQRNIAESQLSAYDENSGLIVGSVTAPLKWPYHETVLFEYRSVNSNGKHNGVLTSGMKHGNPLMDIPTCTKADIPQLCGRLFAVSLLAGDYEIYQATFHGRETFPGHPPMKFTVTKGSVLYLGNLHVSFCQGMRTSFRGDILGSDVTIKDEYERDAKLIRERFSATRSASIEKKLLPDLKWQLRVSHKPYDWQECGIPPNKKNQSDG